MHHDTPLLDRREWFSWSASLAGTALTALLMKDGLARAAGISGEASDPPPHHRSKAKRVVHICLCGGMSHLDSFDYKPALAKYHGKPLPGSEKPETFFGQIGLLRKNDWAFHRRGKSGLWISDLFPHIAGLADELTVIRSMVADSANHTPATFQENTGFRLNGFPVMGSWLSYGLGCETDELPAYVVLPDARGLPAGSTINWSNGFLPARHQGVALRTRGAPVDDLFPARKIAPEADASSRDLLGALNRMHTDRAGGSDALSARVRSYELAAKMQLAVPRVTDLSREPLAMREMYGLNQTETAEFGRSCLLARRLAGARGAFRAGVLGRVVRVRRASTGTLTRTCKSNHGQEAKRIDQPVAALLRDLRQRGMLDDTLVLFTTEFGRTPFAQSAANVVGTGRDHNMYGFSVWLAGAGAEARDRLWRDGRNGLEIGREDGDLARLPRDGAAPAGHRPRTADVLPQRHPATADECAWGGGEGGAAITSPNMVSCGLDPDSRGPGLLRVHHGGRKALSGRMRRYTMSKSMKLREGFLRAAEIEAATPITVGVVPTAVVKSLAHGRTPEHLALAKLVELRRRPMGMTTLELSERVHVPASEIRLLESGVVNPPVCEAPSRDRASSTSQRRRPAPACAGQWSLDPARARGCPGIHGQDHGSREAHGGRGGSTRGIHAFHRVAGRAVRWSTVLLFPLAFRQENPVDSVPASYAITSIGREPPPRLASLGTV